MMRSAPGMFCAHAGRLRAGQRRLHIQLRLRNRRNAACVSRGRANRFHRIDPHIGGVVEAWLRTKVMRSLGVQLFRM